MPYLKDMGLFGYSWGFGVTWPDLGLRVPYEKTLLGHPCLRLSGLLEHQLGLSPLEEGIGFRVQGSGFRVVGAWGLGFRCERGGEGWGGVSTTTEANASCLR